MKFFVVMIGLVLYIIALVWGVKHLIPSIILADLLMTIGALAAGPIFGLWLVDRPRQLPQ
ncbi:MAG: hypothetical protein WCO55_05770 [Candidatus Falkowbacteria bacterium]